MTRTALFVRWVLGIVAAVYLVLGLTFMFLPSTMIGAIDLNAGSPKAMADVRAVYGGLELAIGILLFACFFRKQFGSGLAIGALMLTCMAVGRLVGIVYDPARDALTYGLLAAEVVGVVLCAVALFLARQPEQTAVATDALAPAAATVAPVTSAAGPETSQPVIDTDPAEGRADSTHTDPNL